MWDLPLGGSEEAGSSPPGLSELGTQPRKGPSRRRRAGKTRRRLSPKKLRLLVLGAVLVLVAAYFLFWPSPPEAAFEPNPFSAGNQRVSVSGEAVNVTVSNIGEQPMAIYDLVVIGESADEFELTSDTCGILDPLQSCDAELIFTPAAMGPRQALLEVQSDGPNFPAQLAITGVGIAPLLELSLAEVDFGKQDVGTSSRPRIVALRNTGTAPLAISTLHLDGSGEREFRLRDDQCSKQTVDAGAECTVEFTFSPRAAGKRSVELTVKSDTLRAAKGLSISGEGIWTGAAFAVEPQAIDFAEHLVGKDQPSQRLVVTNRQSSTLRGLRVALEGDREEFEISRNSCDGMTVAPGESCSVQIGFAASQEGEFSAIVEIGNSSLGMFGVEISGRGVAPRWIANTDAIDLESVRVGAGEGSTGTIELGNEGSAAAKVDGVVIEGPNADRFAKRRDSCTGRSVEPGTSCRLELVFDAIREGAHRATVRFEVEAGKPPAAVSLAALGAAPRLTVDLEMIEFGQVHQTTMQEVILTAVNPGTAPLQLEEFAVEGAAARSFRILGGTCFPQATVPPQQRCTLRLGFDPVAEGRRTARLSIRHDAFSGPKSVPLSGTGLPPPEPEIFLSTAELDFGPQPVGERSPIQTVTVSGAGTGRLQLSSFEIVGADASQFQIVPATCHAAPALLPGSSCGVGIRMVPDSPGAKSARLVIRHNSVSRSSSVDLVGEGLRSGG